MASPVPAAAGTMVLKPGVISSNPDPDSCVICSNNLKRWSDEYRGMGTLNLCCGSDVCGHCRTMGKHVKDGGSCHVCGMSGPTLQQAKRNAKKGIPWAQFHLGRSFTTGDFTMQSDYEAIRWYRKAAAQGHPFANYALARCYMEGLGCEIDLRLSKEMCKLSLAQDPVVMKNYFYDSMIILAEKYYNNGDLDQRDDLLETLLRGSPDNLPADTQYRLGGALLLAENWISAEEIFLSSAMNGHVLSAWNLQVFFSEESLFAKQKVWIDHVKKNIVLLPKSQSYNFRMTIEKAKKNFRELRGACASCGVLLDRSTRKLCGGCHTYCYCSRQCQKQHWNNRHCGHKTECIGTQKLIESVKNIPRCDSVEQAPCDNNYIHLSELQQASTAI